MTPEAIPISPHRALLELAARTGRPAGERLDEAVQALRLKLNTPIDSIPGVDPADVWAAAAEADAGKLTPHAEVFARLRARK
jgi:hypothetical protein